ncbi:AAA domain-containing protein [Saccharopolyspora kobensis]|uniref:AAA domain-containing protein n=1 Tax=Saccharopolyspora kobensis TaxID=146035 RepID=A0A1H6AAU8_9PSEU|nr:AAA family ATPase [Saccharopolyspora kobensis]SEG45571.1 AAA domain-containing protein [Saccharopolyspora kobensis]SFE53181.1 AAA domain-containing protein [Saccharopolyspora kobensis]
MGSVGSSSTRLVVLRGNSGSGKSSIASAVRAQLGRTCALVPQDVMRRTVLGERDVTNGFNIGLISTVARYALDCGYHVIVEGILSAQRYATMLAELARDHRGTTTFYYLDVSFAETVRRHETRPQAAEFDATEMLGWYRHLDLLGFPGERVIAEESSLGSSVGRVLSEALGIGEPFASPGT